MHHEMAAVAVVSPVVGIGIPEVEGEMKPAAGIHAAGRDIVEALGSLQVALSFLGTKPNGHGHDVIGAEEFEGLLAHFLHEEFELALFLQDADEYRIAVTHSGLREITGQVLLHAFGGGTGTGGGWQLPGSGILGTQRSGHEEEKKDGEGCPAPQEEPGG